MKGHSNAQRRARPCGIRAQRRSGEAYAGCSLPLQHRLIHGSAGFSRDSAGPARRGRNRHEAAPVAAGGHGEPAGAGQASAQPGVSTCRACRVCQSSLMPMPDGSAVRPAQAAIRHSPAGCAGRCWIGPGLVAVHRCAVPDVPGSRPKGRRGEMSSLRVVAAVRPCRRTRPGFLAAAPESAGLRGQCPEPADPGIHGVGHGFRARRPEHPASTARRSGPTGPTGRPCRAVPAAAPATRRSHERRCAPPIGGSGKVAATGDAGGSIRDVNGSGLSTDLTEGCRAHWGPCAPGHWACRDSGRYWRRPQAGPSRDPMDTHALTPQREARMKREPRRWRAAARARRMGAAPLRRARRELLPCSVRRRGCLPAGHRAVGRLARRGLLRLTEVRGRRRSPRANTRALCPAGAGSVRSRCRVCRTAGRVVGTARRRRRSRSAGRGQNCAGRIRHAARGRRGGHGRIPGCPRRRT